MQVRFLKDCNGTHGSFRKGDVKEITSAVAKAWCSAGVTEAVTDKPLVSEAAPETEGPETATVEAPDAAVKRRGRPKRVG